MEKGYRDYGHDIDNTDSVLEAGLGFAVDLDKPGGFIGRDAVVAAKAAGPLTRRLVQVLVDDPEPLMFHAEVVRRDDRPVGYVRAASYGFTLGGAVGLVMVEAGEPVNAAYLSSGTLGCRDRRHAGTRPGFRCGRCTTPTTCASRHSAMFDGRFVERGDAEYEAARTDALFNARRPSRYPAAVLEATSEADVVAGVKLAAERGWKVAVRSGGHAWAGWSVRDDALLIDLAGLREMTVDVDKLTATVSPAMRGGQDFAPFLREHGLVFPGGHCSTVGLGGYLLQGGQGWNSRHVGVGHARTCSASTS